jgi:hypothetical protein
VICKRAVESKSFINMHLNRLYIPEDNLKPGFYMADMYRAMLKALWPADCARRCSVALKQKTARNKITKERKIEELKKMKDKEISSFPPDCFPADWLAFLMLGLPAGKNSLVSYAGINIGEEDFSKISCKAGHKRQLRMLMNLRKAPKIPLQARLQVI